MLQVSHTCEYKTLSAFVSDCFDQDQKRPADMSSPEPISVIQLLQNSINACDPDLRTQLYPNVVLTGANTLLPGFADRVHSELLSAAPGVCAIVPRGG